MMRNIIHLTKGICKYLMDKQIQENGNFLVFIQQVGACELKNDLFKDN